ncbi:MAG: hypothetical protein QOI62_4 [Solirubrobacteraceae bacterium]|nr:hypothetical protein [Solirubrobacteraceae bacterium]
MRRQSPPDRLIAAIAARQGGVVARGQLRVLGLSAQAIGRRVQAGRLHAVHRGVYAVGHRGIGVSGRRWAAVLACGESAVLSHASAADLWGMRSSASPVPDVSVPRPARVRRPGIRVHSPRLLEADEVTEHDGLPITTPARTLLDLAATGLKGRPLEAALDHAERRLQLDWAEVARLLDRYPLRRGSPTLAATLSRYAPGSVETLSELEEIVLGLCDEFAIPRPQVNRIIEGKCRDFYWPERRLVVEADSYTWHRSPSALDDDRERDVRLQLAGFIALRFTYEQCTNRREYVRHSILVALDVA